MRIESNRFETVPKITASEYLDISLAQAEKFNKLVGGAKIPKYSAGTGLERSSNSSNEITDSEYYSDTNNIRKVLVENFLKRFN